MKVKMLPTALLLVLVATLAAPRQAQGQSPGMKEKFAQAQKANKAALQQYTWVSRTDIQMKGESKKVKLEQVSHDANGQEQKTPIDGPSQQASSGQEGGGGSGRLKKRIIEKKKKEFAELFQDLGQLLSSYRNLQPEQLQAFVKNAQFSLGQGEYGGTIRITGNDIVQPGDTMSIWIDKQTMLQRRLEIDSALDKKTVLVSADFQNIPNYMARAILEYPDKEIQIFVDKSEHRLASASFGAGAQQPPAGGQPQAQAAGAPPQQQVAAPLSAEELDKLLAPVALYPDALVAQILMCSTSPYQVTQLSEWLRANTDLKGSALQEAAEGQGFEPSFAALTIFPQVVHMMAEQIDWTKRLSQALSSDREAVFDSIQRLRSQAMAVGSLQSTAQQEVKTETTQSGQQVIVIQPANPQVVYVPQYNPQTVYIAPPPQPTTTIVVVKEDDHSDAVVAGVIAFTVGVIIGAAANDNAYYWGPHGWRGGAYMNARAWDDYYDHREKMAKDYYEHRENITETRQENRTERQGNRTETQGNRQDDRTERQGTRQDSQSQRETDRETDRADRQTSRETTRTDNQGTRQASTGERQGSRQGATTTSQASRESRAGTTRSASASSTYGSRGHDRTGGQRSQTSRSGTRSGAFSGYQNGRSERAASSRGRSSSRSRSSSRGSRRRR